MHGLLYNLDSGLWTGLDWTGLDWTGLDWTGLDWTGMEWNGGGADHKLRMRVISVLPLTTTSSQRRLCFLVLT